MLLSVTEVFLDGVAGSAQLSSPAFPLIFLGDGLYWRTDIAVEGTAAGWLTMTPGQGYDDADLRLLANTANLKPGTYNARVSIIAPGAINSPQFVRVTVRVREPIPSTIRASAQSLSFSTIEGSSTPTPVQKLVLKMEGETRPQWTASAATLNGGNWLTISPASGAGDGEITATVQSNDLPAGAYAGRITISSPTATNQTITVPVSFTIGRQRALITEGGVVNTASFRGGPVAPGQLITIAGDRLGPMVGIAARMNEATNRYPTSLAGTRVLFDDVPGALLYVGRSQINAQVPAEVAGKQTVKITVESAGFDASTPIEVRVSPASPGLFAYGKDRAAALNQDYALNSPERPAAAGEVIQLYFTGQGLTTPRIPNGAVAPAEAPFAVPDSEVIVLIDGRRAEILFAGMAPGAIGLLQANVRIPSATTPGDNVIVGARIGGVGLTETLMISVR